MKSLKLALLGSVAACVAGPVSAADMAAKKVPPPVKPIEYVKMCDDFGAGFYYMPGATTCLKIGGGVRAQINVHSRNIAGDAWDSGEAGSITSTTPAAKDNFVMGARALVTLDARSKTDYGTLRGYIEFTADPSVSQGNGAALTLRHAYVQLGGDWGEVLAGTTTSQFAPSGALGGYGGAIGDTGGRLPLLAYTYKFSKIISGTVSIEDHDVKDGQTGFKAAPGTEECTSPSSSPICSSGSAIYLAPATLAITDSTVMPDFVANVKGTFDWGTLFASGALSNNRVLANPSATAPWFKDQELGYAASIGGTLKLDDLAKGDQAQLKASYADGATAYLSGPAGDFAILDTVGPDVGLLTTTGFSVQGSFQHFWSPTWNSVAYAGYADYDRNPSADAAVIALANGQVDSAHNVGANLAWTPVAGMTVGAEAFYGSVTKHGAVTDTTDDAVGGIFRFERGF